MTLSFIALAAFAFTFLGGIFALYLKDRLHLILGFSAGAVIGLAFFDLIPEALEIVGESYPPAFVTSVIALGFAIYLILDRAVILHGHDDSAQHRGYAGAGSLSFHSFLDGIGIGLAFHVSSALGIIVTAAVLMHDFSDGINTVSLVLKGGGERRQAFKWLAVNALAPVLGIAATFFFVVPEAILGLLLALFSGFFLYIGTSDLLPESHHAHPTILTTVMTLVGMGVLYAVVKIAGI